MIVKTEKYQPCDEFAPVDDLCQQWIAGIIDDLGGPSFELYGAYGAEPDRIANVSYDGFIPYTDGGWLAAIPGDTSAAQSSGSDAGLLSAEIERLGEGAREAWMGDNPDKGDPWADDLDDDTHEEWYEYQSEWMQSVYYVDVRAIYYRAGNRRNESGENEVYFVASVNFDEYGRDKHSITLWNCNVPVSSVTQDKLDTMRSQAIDAIVDMKAKPKG